MPASATRVEPFRDCEKATKFHSDVVGHVETRTLQDLEQGLDVLWWGPRTVSLFVLKNPTLAQFIFVINAFVAFILLIVGAAKDRTNSACILGSILFVLVSLFLMWFGRAIHLVSHYRQLDATAKVSLHGLQEQNDTYKKYNLDHERLNAELSEMNCTFKAELEDMSKQNNKYSEQNMEHERLNSQLQALNDTLSVQIEELAGQSAEHREANEEQRRMNSEVLATNQKLKVQVTELFQINDNFKEQNAKHQELISRLQDKVNDFSRVENQLKLLSTECNGSVGQLRSLLDRFERNLRLDSTNTVLQFFDRADINRNKRIDPEEVPVFVDNLAVLWQHVPGFDQEKLKQSLLDRGGVDLQDIRGLIDSVHNNAQWDLDR